MGIILKHKGKKDRPAAVFRAIVVVREGRAERMTVGFANGKWMNEKLSQAFLSFGQPAMMNFFVNLI